MFVAIVVAPVLSDRSRVFAATLLAFVNAHENVCSRRASNANFERDACEKLKLEKLEADMDTGLCLVQPLP